MINRLLDLVCFIMVVAGVWSFVNAPQAAVVFSIGIVLFIITVLSYFAQKYLDDMR